ncbi:Tho complex 7 [Mycena sanguinolenta]|uniref:Tho complex 7 n=1 Tax=Mycena sanguinolenta TaxID=230812 RepID=A0A8H6YA86_9AGAR|nr:Tho complex 7 [Mycena sanguinolenta]
MSSIVGRLSRARALLNPTQAASTFSTAMSPPSDAPSAQQKPIEIPPLTTEEEDQIILARITNDERPLRRVIKKFHTYTALSHAPPGALLSAPGATAATTSVDDAREAFLVELASFQLLLRKSVMICEAEARQVDEYQREKERINDEHGTLRGQIEQLKTSLEHEQMLRKRKMEYDFVAEKVNTLPTREELEQTIESLENDMAAIRAEHDTQNRLIQAQKAAMDEIVASLEALRFMGKDREGVSTDLTPRDTPGPEGTGDTATAAADGEAAPPKKMEEGEEETVPESAVPAEPALEDDIEMGEVEEPEKNFKGKKKREEELEEGEASDASSELSEPPNSDD